MASATQWSVRIERQPHRDAVRRLRKAYKLLWQISESTSTMVESDRKAEKASYSVQEVRK